MLLVAMCLAVVAYAGVKKQNPLDTKVKFAIDRTGDSAEIIRLNQFTPNDSFTFSGDIEGYGDGAYPSLGAVDSAYTYTTGPQLARLVVTYPIDTTAVYRCSVDCGTNVYGFTYDVPEAAADTATVKFIGELVDSINNVTGMKDTISGEDSTTYVLIRSLIPQQELESGARWSVRVTADDAGTELALGDSNYTTIASVCDGMVATINALDSINLRLTAANSGDTVVTVTSDVNGIAFTFDIADTAMDTTYTRGNYATWTSAQDTIPLFSMSLPNTFHTLYGDITIRASDSATSGYGTLDTGKIWLESYDDVNGYLTIDSGYAEGLPYTLHVAWGQDTTGGAVDLDTLWREGLRIIVLVSDSSTHPGLDTVSHNIEWEFILR